MKEHDIIVILATCIVGSHSILDFSALYHDANVQEQYIKVAKNIRTAKGYPRNMARSLKSNKIFRDMLKDACLTHEEWQHAINCGPEGSLFKLTWCPKMIDPEGTLKFKLEFRAPVSFSIGMVTVDVYMLDDVDPIFTIQDTIPCSDIEKLVPYIHCPIQKNFPFKLKYEFTELTKLPVGDYILVVKIKNENNELFACLNGTIYIEPK